MITQPAQEIEQEREAPVVVERPALRADRVSKLGRGLTVVTFVTVAILLVLTFAWIGGRRINNFFVSRADRSFQAGDYQAAARGMSEARLGRNVAAVSDFSAALDRDGSLVNVLAARARAHARLTDWQAAAADMSDALRLQPGDPGYWLDRARYNLQLARPTL